MRVPDCARVEQRPCRKSSLEAVYDRDDAAGRCTTSMKRSGLDFSTDADGGFTLVELLVVVSVIALLVAILVPSLHHAREYSYAAVCRSNLGQLFRTLHAGESLEIPSATGWVGFAQGKGAGGVLCCPKDDLDDSGDAAFGKSGAIRQIDPPASEVFDSLESNTYIFAWRERASFALPASVKVNLSRPGRYVSTSEYSTATISAGTVVDCYFLHFDPVGDGPASASGQLSFGGEIIGVICLEGDLSRRSGACAGNAPRRRPPDPAPAASAARESRRCPWRRSPRYPRPSSCRCRGP